jgi:hypothetical protein
MGKFVAAGPDGLLPASNQRGKTLVDNEKTGKQGLPIAPGRAYGMNWTRILADQQLESPGYQETLLRMRKEGRIKGY